LDDVSLQLQEAAHFDGPAEGHLPVPLGEVHVAHAQVGALHKDVEVHLAPPAEVLDVAIAAVLAGDTVPFGALLPACNVMKCVRIVLARSLNVRVEMVETTQTARV
jgi:hypothetical protein